MNLLTGKSSNKFCISSRRRSSCNSKSRCSQSQSKNCASSKCSMLSRKSKSKCGKRKRNFCSMTFIQDSIQYFSYLYALPCLVTDFLVSHAFPWQYATLPLMITIFPTAIYIIDGVTNCLLLDSLIIGNVTLLVILGWNHCCPYVIAAGLIYLLCHFILRVDGVRELTKEVIYNIGMCIFCLCCLLSLGVEIYSQGDLPVIRGFRTSKIC